MKFRVSTALVQDHGIWPFGMLWRNGHVLDTSTWKPIAREWVERNLDGYTTRAVGEEMFRYSESGGIIDRVRETRPEWSEHRFHYDFRLPIAGKMISIETVLIDRDPTDPTIPFQQRRIACSGSRRRSANFATSRSVVEPEKQPYMSGCVEVSARTADGTVKALRHRQHLTVGVQFHPESILTTGGYTLLADFLRLAGLRAPRTSHSATAAR